MIPLNWRQRLIGLFFIATSGMLLELSCAGVGEKVVTGINPCGTILNCDPVEWDLITSDYPDWDLDPTCTVPGQCGTVWPPVAATTTQ